MSDYIRFIQLIKEISQMNNNYLLILLFLAVVLWRLPEIIRVWLEYKKYLDK